MSDDNITILEYALSATKVHFTVFDREGRYLYVNPIGLQAQNLNLTDVVGKTWRDLGFPEEVGLAFEKRLEKVFAESMTVRNETLFPTQEGPRIFETVMQPAFNNEGMVVAAVATHQDITEKREAEESLRESNAELQTRTNELAAALDTARYLRDQAEKANRAKDTFLANMSHELRTPLNAILGYSQLMARDANVTPTQQRYLKTIARSGEHLLGLINDVLTMAKIEAGGTTLQENSFDLHQQLHGLQEIFQLRADAKEIALHLDIALDVPRYVVADEGKLRQTLMNLLSNAIKFTKEGSVTLRVGCERQADGIENSAVPDATPSTLLHFEVEDTGVGIAPEEMKALFEPFVQTASGHKSQEGTGLGLPISQRFIDLMSGELSVNSIVGQGTTFHIHIPTISVAADEVEAGDLQVPRRITGIEPGQTAPDGGAFRLLIVEDDVTNRELLIKLLTPFGFEMRYAVNGVEGVKKWEEWQPHLVWMDIRLPVMDGYEATRQIKARAEAMDCPVIIVALTASAFEEDSKVILASGCDDLVRKPYLDYEIFNVLHRHLGVRFIYESSSPDRATSGSFEDLSAIVEGLPATWVTDLHQAIVALDTEQMLALVETIRPQAPQLADILGELIRDFQYDKLMELVALGM